jgi:hypothetical protein
VDRKAGVLSRFLMIPAQEMDRRESAAEELRWLREARRKDFSLLLLF